MKLLLVSDIPPCTNYTAGLVLDQLCRFMPRGSVAVANVRNPELTDAVLTADLNWVPITYLRKPREHGRVFHGRSKFLNQLASFALETYHEVVSCRRLTAQIVSFGRDFGADAVLAVLQGQTGNSHCPAHRGKTERTSIRNDLGCAFDVAECSRGQSTQPASHL